MFTVHRRSVRRAWRVLAEHQQCTDSCQDVHTMNTNTITVLLSLVLLAMPGRSRLLRERKMGRGGGCGLACYRYNKCRDNSSNISSAEGNLRYLSHLTVWNTSDTIISYRQPMMIMAICVSHDILFLLKKRRNTYNW